MTALGDHATAELTYQGITDPEKTNIITIVGTFAEFTDEEIPDVLAKVTKLLCFQPLSELTNDPDEWTLRDNIVNGQQIWQSTRYPDAWTYDPTFAIYFLLSGHNGNPGGPYNTIPAES